MNEDSMPIPIISEVFMAQEYRKFQLMPDLHVRTAMDQKDQEVVPIVIMMLLILHIVTLKNQFQNRLRKE